MMQTIKKQCAFFLNNRLYMVALVLSAIAGYGYVLGHGTCGIDDVAISAYFQSGLGVAIGRWPYYLINKIISVVPFTDFVMDFFCVLLLMFSAILFCGIFREVIHQELPIWGYIVFSVFFLDYSLIAPVFVFYLQNGIGFLYVLVAIAVYGFWRYFTSGKLTIKERIGINLVVLCSVFVAVSFFESAASVFLLCAYGIVLIDCMASKKLKAGEVRKFFQYSFYIFRFLVYAMILRRGIRFALMRLFDIQPFTFYRSVTGNSWIFTIGIKNAFLELLEVMRQIAQDYFVKADAYFAIRLFVIASGIFCATLVFLSIKQKSLCILWYGLCTYLLLFSLCFIQMSSTPYRACQHFTVFVSGVFGGISLWIFQQNRGVKYLGCILLATFWMNSVIELNRLFQWDYDNTNYEISCIRDIAQTLQEGDYDIENKPIAFVGEWDGNVRTTQFEYSQMTGSLINWGVEGVAGYCGYNSAMRMIMTQLGYDFQWVSDEQYQEIIPLYYSEYFVENFETYRTENYENGYPQKGYIEEMDDYIVIKL